MGLLCESNELPRKWNLLLKGRQISHRTTSLGGNISALLNMTDRHAINKEIFNYLRPQKPQTSQFYILPRIHKDEISGRRIVSSCGAPTENIPSLWILLSNNWCKNAIVYFKYHRLPNKIKVCPWGSTGMSVTNVGCSFSLYQYFHVEGVEACRVVLSTRSVQ